MKPAGISGTKSGNIRKTKLMSLQQTLRTTILIEEQMNLRGVTNLQVT
jgi:hypothetical protein